MNTTTATIATKTINVPGIGEVEVPVTELAALVKDISSDAQVREARKNLTKDAIKAKAQAKYEAKKAEKMADPEWAAKVAARKANAEKNKTLKALKESERLQRQEKKTAEASRVAALIEASGTKIKAERIVRAEVVPHKAHGLDAIRGYKAILVFTDASGAEVRKNQTFDLDVTGVGVLDDMKAQADACLLAFLKSAK